MKNVTRLTKQERDVLSIVDLEGRLSFSEIGRRAGLSKQTARNVYERLVQQQVIKGVRPVIDLNGIGRTGYGVYAQFKSVDSKRQTKILQALAELQNVYWVAPLGGRFDLVFALQTQSLHEFDHGLSEIQNKFSKDLRTASVALRVAMAQFPRFYLGTQGTIKRHIGFGPSERSTPLDELDGYILNQLTLDGRSPSSDIARRLHLPRSTVQKRMINLENKGVVTGYYTLIQANCYGYQLYQLLVTTNVKTLAFSEALAKYAHTSANIVTLVRTFGSWDFELTCEVATAEDLQALVVDLRSRFPEEIAQIESLVLFNHFVKYGYSVGESLTSFRS